MSGSHLEVFRRQLDAVTCGQHRYVLRHAMNGRLMPSFDRRGYRFTIDSLPGIVGEGKTRPDAMASFEQKFHSRFQNLLAKRPFEMSDEERLEWYAFKVVFDVDKYRRSQPIVMRRFGVAINESGRHAVMWEGRDDKELVDLGMYPREFPTFATGQPFEAYVEVDQDSRRTIRVLYAKKTSPTKQRTPAENEAFWNSLPGTSTLPASSFK